MLSDMVAFVAILQKSCFVLKVLVRRFNKTLQHYRLCPYRGRAQIRAGFVYRHTASPGTLKPKVGNSIDRRV